MSQCEFANTRQTASEEKLYSSINVLIDRENLIFYLPDSIKIKKFLIKNNLVWYNYKFKLCIFNTNDDFDNKHNFFIDKKIVKKGIYVRNWKHGDKLIDENLENKAFSIASEDFKMKVKLEKDKEFSPFLFKSERKN